MFLKAAEQGTASESNVTARIQMITRESDENLLFETRDEKHGKAVLHRSYVSKD